MIKVEVEIETIDIYREEIRSDANPLFSTSPSLEDFYC